VYNTATFRLLVIVGAGSHRCLNYCTRPLLNTFWNCIKNLIEFGLNSEMEAIDVQRVEKKSLGKDE